MNKAEFARAVEIATSDRDLSNVETQPLHGYGRRGFGPVAATVDAVAAVIRWQCCYLGGGIDAEELSSIRGIFRRRVEVVG